MQTVQTGKTELLRNMDKEKDNRCRDAYLTTVVQSELHIVGL